MAELMIGADLMQVTRSAGRDADEARMVVDGLSIPGEEPFGVTLDDVSATVRAGEILGIAGVAGNGQNELLAALSGEAPAPAAEMIRIDDHAVGRLGPGARRRLGLAAVPEERNGHGAVPEFSLADNAVLTARHRLALVRLAFVLSGRARAYADRVIGKFSVRATGPGASAASLSGGNLQKYIMGREILQSPSVLVVSQPTWGVDAGAAAQIHQALMDLAAQGSAIVVISQDLDELLSLADNLAVINEGRLSPARPVAETSIEEIGLLMGGVHGADGVGEDRRVRIWGSRNAAT